MRIKAYLVIFIPLLIIGLVFLAPGVYLGMSYAEAATATDMIYKIISSVALWFGGIITAFALTGIIICIIAAIIRKKRSKKLKNVAEN